MGTCKCCGQDTSEGDRFYSVEISKPTHWSYKIRAKSEEEARKKALKLHKDADKEESNYVVDDTEWANKYPAQKCAYKS